MDLISNVLANDYIDNPKEWTFGHIVSPNRSCLDTRRVYIRLRNLLIGDTTLVSGRIVTRIDNERFAIQGSRLKFNFETAQAILEGRAEAIQPTLKKRRAPLPPVQGCALPPKPITELPLFQGLTHAA